ncbi:hypothetical protein J1605_006910 [Eschrichtius robustus]|uniref:Uncharacterized protein n=1 Tax=Eschrichtius robustus TaxID=9764 RepID=A0AB34H4X7_ESCRO|nr:hypothetical protein J1605_006910 [Eschrichtius robustus]
MQSPPRSPHSARAPLVQASGKSLPHKASLPTKMQPGEPVLKQASFPWGIKAATSRAYREAKTEVTCSQQQDLQDYACCNPALESAPSPPGLPDSAAAGSHQPLNRRLPASPLHRTPARNPSLLRSSGTGALLGKGPGRVCAPCAPCARRPPRTALQELSRDPPGREEERARQCAPPEAWGPGHICAEDLRGALGLAELGEDFPESPAGAA